MSKPSNFGPNFDREDAFAGFLDVAAKLCFYVGLLAVVGSVGFLLFNFFHFAGNADPHAATGNNMEMLGKILISGAVGAAIGSTYLFWGEETMHGVQLLVAALLIFCPVYMPVTVQGGNVTDAAREALTTISKGGIVLGILSLIALLVEMALRVRARSIEGSRLEQLRYGKGVKEERSQNKFMGKCWQLPYCRKFVREKCPIYHAKRTCWKERVGCMCEEEVIRNAMENRIIPKDSIAAARYIPVNNKLTGGQKRERCRQCVIFNEHLKHQYKLMLPITIGSFALLYIAGRTPLLAYTGAVIQKANGVLTTMTYNEAKINTQSMTLFQEIFLDCFMFVLLAYVLKLLEYVIFKLKV